MKKLTSDIPSTLKNWHNICIQTFGENTMPSKFFEQKIVMEGEDSQVLTDEEYLLFVLGQLYKKEQELESLINKNNCCCEDSRASNLT